MAGFAVTAIGFPILGVAAVAKSGGLDVLARRVHPVFASIFTLLIYVSIGPGLAIPRTASTSFEMAVLPFIPTGIDAGKVQLIYSAAFFFVAFLIALKPEKLTECLGKFLTPCLLALIFIVFVRALFFKSGSFGASTEAYQAGSFVKGFLEGYQTMDTIAALNFGIVIALGIRAKGVTEERAVVKETMKAGLIAGGLLLAIYSALCYIGAMVSGTYQNGENGAQVLTYVVQKIFGQAGLVLLGVIFLIACLNTCVGLLCCCSEYFKELIPKVPYIVWSAVFAGISFLVSNLGLSNILKVSVPILQTIYPMAIVLIVLAFLHPWIAKWRFVYPVTILMTGLTSVFYILGTLGVKMGVITTVLKSLPLYKEQLVWIIPAIFGLAVGILSSILLPKRGKNEKKKNCACFSITRRSELMKQAGFTFEIQVSKREEVYQSERPDEIVEELSLLKAEDVAQSLEQENVIVIGADTVVALDGKILGKPKSKEDAFAMIQSLQGRAHQVYTGTAILIFDEFGNCRTVNHAVCTEVFVNPMSEEEITDYIEHENVMDKAGAYGIQGRFAIHIDKIEGDYYNVVGLPISYIYEVLKEEVER